MVMDASGGPPWWIIGVYEPQSDADKLAFLAELQDFHSTIAGPWVLGGNLNMISSVADKSNDRINHRMMNCFRRFYLRPGAS